jgi:hypothetical protein
MSTQCRGDVLSQSPCFADHRVPGYCRRPKEEALTSVDDLDLVEESSHIHGNLLDPPNTYHAKNYLLHVLPATRFDLSDPLETLHSGPWHTATCRGLAMKPR